MEIYSLSIYQISRLDLQDRPQTGGRGFPKRYRPRRLFTPSGAMTLID
jgi:hypothetical protein